MSLKDFMQKLQEQDESDVVYSQKPEDEVRILPPVKNKEHVEVIKKDEKTDQIKVIPPKKEEENKVVNPFRFVSNPEKPKITFNFNLVPEKKKEEPKKEEVRQEEKVVPKQEDKQLSEFEKRELLFKKSGTPEIKKTTWLEVYTKAQASKARNITSDTIREGRFYVSMNDEIALLPKYDCASKTVEEIFDDKWLKN